MVPKIHFRLILIKWRFKDPKGRLKWMDEFCRQKGIKHALDHIVDSLNFVACGIGERLHDERIRSYLAGHRRHLVSNQTYSGKKNILAIWPLTGKR